MAGWKMPPKAKVYEALSAVADGRVRIVEASAGDVAAGAGTAADAGAGTVAGRGVEARAGTAAGGAGTGGGQAWVTSSSGTRAYTVTWSGDSTRPGSRFSSNDNASYWQGYAGYPIIAVLLATGAIAYDPEVARPLAGVLWKTINERFKRDYDRAVAAVLEDVEAAGGDRAAIAAQADTIYEQLAALRLERGKRGAPPPKPNHQP
jgi:hypothetical protein